MPDVHRSSTEVRHSTRIIHTGPIPYVSEEDCNTFTQAQRKALSKRLLFKAEAAFNDYHSFLAEGKILSLLNITQLLQELGFGSL